jgi:serine/threonine protein kinase
VNEESLFHLALAQPNPAARAAFLDEACAGQPELRARLDQLLQAHEQPASLLEKPAPAEGPTGDDIPGLWLDPAAAPRLTEGPGTLIGPYKLLQQIGEGGMGVVFMAEQEQPVQRRVALKIIKPGGDSRQVIARLEAERQALALMDHPNIARFLDAGTTEQGRPYFVMELVKGTPITKYCDEYHLTPRDRLNLFIPVCQAVQHAHQKGIIHRDLKPSNILVGLYDGRPVAKVIDFGVAKATGRKLTQRTLFTEFGAIIGTLEYMSPEQAQLDNVDIDTRSDVYSLGVLLYQLLTGTTPLQSKRLRRTALLEALRLIREEEPPRPSTRLSSTEELPSIAANRGIEPRELSVLLRGELDWIVMKALEKDRGRRYETANGLATDLQHYLADEPVQACPPSALRRLRRFIRRNRVFLGTAALVGLALVAGTVVSLWQAAQARKNAETARGNEGVALEAKADLENANKELRKTRDEVETQLARSLLRPLSRQPGPLTETEVESLEELAGNPGETLWKRVIEQAVRDPKTTRQFKTRAEFALHAAVGLDPAKRSQVERLLGERLLDPRSTDAQRADLALVAVSLGGLTPAAQAQVAQALSKALGKATDPASIRDLAAGLSALADRLEPKEAARVCSEGARILSRTLTRSTSPAFEPLAQALVALAAHMEPEEANRVCSQTTGFLTQTMNANPSASWIQDAFARSLIVLAPYVEPEQAAKAAAVIPREMNGWSGGDRKMDALAALAARMTRKEAVRVCSRAAALLTNNIRGRQFFTDDAFLEVWVNGLKALAPYLESEEAAKAALVLFEEIIKTKKAHKLSALLFAGGLAALGPSMESGAVAKITALLGEQLANTKDHGELDSLLSALDALSPYMDPKEAARLYSPAAYAKMVSGSSRLIEGFSAATGRMKTQDASNALLRAMAGATHPSELRGFAEALSRVAARMEPRQAALVCSQAAAILLGAGEKVQHAGFRGYTVALSVQGFCALAPYLEDREAGQLYSQAIGSVFQAATVNAGFAQDSHFAETLAVLAARMDRSQAAQAVDLINRRLAGLLDLKRREVRVRGDATRLVFRVHELESFAEALAAVAGRLNPNEAARACAQAPEILIEFLVATHDTSRLAVALSDVAARLEPQEAARVCAQAAAILSRADPTPYPFLEYGLSALAAHMEPEEAARVCSVAAAKYFRSMAMGKLDKAGLPRPAGFSASSGLSALLTASGSRERTRRSSGVVAAIGLTAGTGLPVAGPVVLQTVAAPLPGRLSPKELVGLLKLPTGIGLARRIILDQIGNHYKRVFADQWAFVRYAQEEKLDLDFTTPGKDPSSLD